MTHPILVAASLALATPFVVAEEKKADKAAAAKSLSTHSASDRQVAKQLQATGAGAATLGAGDRPDVRNWARIDTNNDHLISPDEMEKYLQEIWQARKK
ncbi:hypothetical protein [Ideonella sp. A 288]|uniref:hypothetical protein n=1 Tax=Ideonella sp. A 288 TaxID=1962181 RepID=UPI00118541FD|nr:hypothetical protein [Ideonella sp. A 288]